MGYQLAAVLFTPLQIAAGIFFMYHFIGISFLSGIGMMIITIVFTFFLSKKSIAYNEEVLKVKDERMKSTQEMIDIIKFIKVNAIEKYFFRKINQKRRK